MKKPPKNKISLFSPCARRGGLGFGLSRKEKTGVFRTRNASGFVLVLLLFALPILLILMSWLALRLSQMFELRQLQKVCRENLIAGQVEARDKINALLQLNPIVRALKLEKKAAQIALAAALISLDPPAIAEARQWLKGIRYRQVLIRERQALILAEGRLALGSALKKSEVSARNLNGSRPLFRLNIRSLDLSLENGLAVQAASSDLFPEYEFQTPFEDQQALERHWLVEFTGQTSGVKTWIPFDLRFQESCGASLENSTSGLRPRLYQGK